MFLVHFLGSQSCMQENTLLSTRSVLETVGIPEKVFTGKWQWSLWPLAIVTLKVRSSRFCNQFLCRLIYYILSSAFSRSQG